MLPLMRSYHTTTLGFPPEFLPRKLSRAVLLTSANKAVNRDELSTAANLQKHKPVKENQTGMGMGMMVTLKTWPYGKNMQGGGENTVETLKGRKLST